MEDLEQSWVGVREELALISPGAPGGEVWPRKVDCLCASKCFPYIETQCRVSPVVQWSRVHLEMQKTLVRILVWGDSTCLRATKPLHHDEPTLESLQAATTEPTYCNH